MGRSKRNYRMEYDKYQGQPEQIRNRAMRNAARRMYEETHGDVPSSDDIDHRRAISKGGSNNPGNLHRVSQRTNRSFKRTQSAGMK